MVRIEQVSLEYYPLLGWMCIDDINNVWGMDDDKEEAYRQYLESLFFVLSDPEQRNNVCG